MSKQEKQKQQNSTTTPLRNHLFFIHGWWGYESGKTRAM